MALSFRYTRTRVLFPSMTYWSTCMDKCLMYSQARAPSYSTQEELQELIMWALATSVDKVALATGTRAHYSAFPSWFFWVAYRYRRYLIFTLLYSLHFFQFSDIEVEGDWRNYYTNDKAVLNLGQKTTTKLEYNCGVQGPDFVGWSEFVCFEPIMLTCVCEHPQQMYLQLRGLCSGSHIDRFYVPRNGSHHKQFDF